MRGCRAVMCDFKCVPERVVIFSSYFPSSVPSIATTAPAPSYSACVITLLITNQKNEHDATQVIRSGAGPMIYDVTEIATACQHKLVK